MKSIIRIGFFIFFMPTFAKSQQNISMWIENKSTEKVTVSHSNTYKETIKAGEKKLIVTEVFETPFWLYFSRDTLQRVKNQLQSFYVINPKVRNRKIIILKDTIIRISNQPEELIDTYYYLKFSKKYFNFDSLLIRNKENIGSVYLFENYYCRQTWNIDTITSKLNLINNGLLESKKGLEVLNYIQSRRAFSIGYQFNGFELQDTSGQTINFSNIKSKFILLDFWFATCVPCLESFPSLKTLYSNTSREDLEIIGISVDNGTRIEGWKKVIKEKKLDWIQVLDPLYSISYKTFGIVSYPTKLLLDKDRKIIRINPDDEEIKKIIEENKNIALADLKSNFVEL